jgi:pyridoxamine 5'-phosphate oxidase family protein
VARTGRAAIVIDDVRPPWRPRGVEVRGRAEAIVEPPMIRIHAERIVSWGLDD